VLSAQNFFERMSHSSSSSKSSSSALAEAVEEQLEWEEFDSKRGVSFLQHMVAGSCAGVAEHLLMYPIDTFKVSV